MNTWNYFVACPMARQILTEVTGQDCSHISTQDIRDNYPAINQLISKWSDFFGAMPDHPLECCKPRKLTVEEKYLHYTGRVSEPFGQMSHSLRLETDAGVVNVSLDSLTKLQKHHYSKNEIVHIYVGKTSSANVARYVISDEAFAVITYFGDNRFDEALVLDFVRLSPTEQAAYTALVTDSRVRRSALYALAYLASAAISCGNYAVSNIPNIAEIYNTFAREKVDCDTIPSEWLLIYAKGLFGRSDCILHSSFNLWRSYELKLFALFAAINGYSAWHCEGISVAQIIVNILSSRKEYRLDEFFATLVPSSKANSILRDIIKEYPTDSEKKYSVDGLLFDALCQCEPLSEEVITQICDILFRTSIYQKHAHDICKLLNGPNATAFRTCIMNGFFTGCKNSVAEYTFCAAAICNTERVHAEKAPFDEALSGIRNAPTLSDYLLNVACLDMLLWCDRIGTYRIPTSLPTIDRSMQDKLLSFLSTPDKLCYPIVASAVNCLVLHNITEPSALNEEIRLASIEALNCDSIRTRAEEILALIIPPSPPLSQCAKPFISDLANTYQTRYDACMANPKSEENPEVLFAVLCHLGLFDTPEAQCNQLKQIVERSLTDSAYPGKDSKWRIGHWLQHFTPSSNFWVPTSTNVDHEIFGETLSKQRQADIQRLSESLETSSQKYPVASAQEALDIIKFILLCPCTSQSGQKHVQALTKNVQMEVPDAGSFLVVSWFNVLCRYGQADQILDYYRTHSDILDRPSSVSGIRFSQRKNELYDSYRAYQTRRKRVVDGIYTAVRNGNPDVLSAFLSSEFQSMVDNQEFVKPLIKDGGLCLPEDIARIYGGRHGTQEALEQPRASTETQIDDVFDYLKTIDIRIKELSQKLRAAEHSSSTQINEFQSAAPHHNSQPLVGPADCSSSSATASSFKCRPSEYYDDLTVLRHTLFSQHEQHNMVLSLGYNDDYNMVDMAVSINPASLRYASPRLQADTEIVSAAIHHPTQKDSSPSVLQWVSKELRNDKALMLQAVLANPVAYTYISPALKNDPDFLAIPHWDETDNLIPDLEIFRDGMK